jgi:methionine-rich copper-binding protein CopC
MRRRATYAALVTLFVLSLTPTAGGHGGLQTSDPTDGARLSKAPRRVTMTFSEAPTRDSVVKVLDGCKRDVVASTSVAGDGLVAALARAQPGKWTASYRVISAEDGHLTRGKLRFTVEGTKDCNPAEDGRPSDEGGGGGAVPGDDGETFPVVPVAVGAAGLVLIGLLVRRVSAG